MSTPQLDTRVPLRVPTAGATFLIGIAGYLGVNLSPYMISALQNSTEMSFLSAGWVVTGVLLLVLDGMSKLALGFIGDSTAFIVTFIVWNTIYALCFMYFVAVAAALSADGRWSGPLMATYLVGSALTPVIGAALLGALGPVGFVAALGLTSVVLIFPTATVAAVSSRITHRERTPGMDTTRRSPDPDGGYVAEPQR